MSAPDPGPHVERDEVVVEPDGRLRAARVINGVIRLVTGLFALVLAIHIVLIAANANMGNAFAQFVEGWATAVNLGLSNLFTPGNEKLAVLLNEGIAAILWLIIGWVLTTLISRILFPGPERHVRYRRHSVQ